MDWGYRTEIISHFPHSLSSSAAAAAAAVVRLSFILSLMFPFSTHIDFAIFSLCLLLLFGIFDLIYEISFLSLAADENVLHTMYKHGEWAEFKSTEKESKMMINLTQSQKHEDYDSCSSTTNFCSAVTIFSLLISISPNNNSWYFANHAVWEMCIAAADFNHTSKKNFLTANFSFFINSVYWK